MAIPVQQLLVFDVAQCVSLAQPVYKFARRHIVKTKTYIATFAKRPDSHLIRDDLVLANVANDGVGAIQLKLYKTHDDYDDEQKCNKRIIIFEK